MAKIRKFLDIDVLTAARQRVSHLYDIFDTVVMCFSGGKDSLATLHLVKEEATRRKKLPVPVVFRDEELIPDAVVDFVNEYRKLPWLKMHYFAIPLASSKFILGRSFEYVQWDRNRPHIRPIPDHAIQQAPGEPYEVFDQYTTDAYIAKRCGFRGKVAFVTGIRAAESLMRYRACVNKLNENYITATAAKNVQLAKPIYDWSEDDIFKFFHDQEIRYCPLYDAQHLAGNNLRVATPLHSENAKRIGKLREYAPVFYQQIMDMFPEMLVQERYWSELDTKAVVRQYGQSMEGVRTYILDHITDEHQQAKALAMFKSVSVRAARLPDSYPPDYILSYFMGGSFKRELMPKNTPHKGVKS